MNRICLRDYGILPGGDATFALHALFSKYPRDTAFVFEPGDYFFSPQLSADYRLSNSDVLPERKLGIWMKGMKNVVLEGNGARLLFSGHMQPVTMDHCEDVVMRGFTIDWEKPLIAEGVVTAFDEKSVDLFVDPAAFPHRFTGDWLEFDTGNGEWYPLTPRGQIQLTRNPALSVGTRGISISPNAASSRSGRIPIASASEISRSRWIPPWAISSSCVIMSVCTRGCSRRNART